MAAHLLWEQVAAGSIPAAPTNTDEWQKGYCSGLENRRGRPCPPWVRIPPHPPKHLLPPPWRVLQTPLIAGQACNGAALTFRRKTSRQACSGRPCSVVAFTEQGFFMTFHGPASLLLPGIFFPKEDLMRNIHRPFWQELRDELSPRRNAAGWACVLLLLALFALVGELPAETSACSPLIVSR